MLPVEFWLMCEGYNEYKEGQYEFIRDVAFGAARYNAANTAMSNEAQKKIARQKFPWEKPTNPRDEVLSYDKMKGLFNMISKSKE